MIGKTKIGEFLISLVLFASVAGGFSYYFDNFKINIYYTISVVLIISLALINSEDKSKHDE